MPACFTQSPDGMLYVWNGIDPPMRWDGFTPELELAGIVAPTTAMTVSGSGQGEIVGNLYAYVRFLDRYGNTSSMSPISDVYTPETSVGDVIDATFSSPIVIETSQTHGLNDGQIVFIEDVIGNDAANGVFTVTVQSSTKFQLDDTLGNGKYLAGGTVRTGVNKLTYSSIPTSDDPKVVQRQILRTKSDGDLTVVYEDILTTDLSSTSLDSELTDDELGDSVALQDSIGNDLAVSRFTPPPQTKAVACHHLGRMFSAVVEPYEVGCVEVEYGSRTVTGIGTEWKSGFAARFLDVAGGNNEYEIDSVESETSLTLIEPYTGPTDKFAMYAIRPPLGERRELRWSEAGYPEAWPVGNSRTLTEDPGSGELTGLMPLKSFMYILAQSRVYKWSYQSNPATDSFLTVASMNGCANNRCWVIVDGVAYMLCNTGIHAFVGNDDDVVSAPVQDVFENFPSSQYRINWKAHRYFHALHDPGERVIRWFVALTGHYTPHHAICLDYRRKFYWIEEYPFPVGCSTLGLPGGRQQGYLGSHGKRWLATMAGTLDGPDPSAGTVRGTVTSAGPTWLADSAATFPSAGLIGFPIQITVGTGKGQTRIISSKSGTRINIVQPWHITPDSTSVYQIGGIKWRWKSGLYKWVESDKETERSLAIQFKKTRSAAAMTMRLYRDQSTDPQLWETTRLAADNNGVGFENGSADMNIDTTKTNGFVQERFNDSRDYWADGRRFIQIEVDGVTNDTQQRIHRVRLDGVE